MTTLKQNDRERAQFALDVIKNFKKKELRTIALKFPAMVVNNGLGQTIAFLLSEGTKESKVDKNKADGYFYSMIQKWLCEKVKIYDTPVEKEESWGDYPKQKDNYRCRSKIEVIKINELSYLSQRMVIFLGKVILFLYCRLNS